VTRNVTLYVKDILQNMRDAAKDRIPTIRPMIEQILRDLESR